MQTHHHVRYTCCVYAHPHKNEEEYKYTTIDHTRCPPYLFTHISLCAHACSMLVCPCMSSGVVVYSIVPKWCVCIVMAFMGSTYYCQKRPSDRWCRWGWWVGAMLHPSHYIYLASSTLPHTKHSSPVIRLAHSWRIGNCGNKTQLVLLPCHSTVC